MIEGAGSETVDLGGAAKMLGISRDTAYRMRRQGRFPVDPLPGIEWRYSVVRLRRFIEGTDRGRWSCSN